MNSRERPSSGQIEKKKQAYCLAAAEDRLADQTGNLVRPLKQLQIKAASQMKTSITCNQMEAARSQEVAKSAFQSSPYGCRNVRCQPMNGDRKKSGGDLEKVDRLFSVRDKNIFHSCCQVARRLLQPIRGHLLKVRHFQMNKAVSSSQSHHPSGRGTPPCLNVTSSPWQCTDASRIGEQKRCLGRSPL